MRTTALFLALAASPLGAQQIQTYRPFGTLREQADVEQRWLDQRMKAVLPVLMKKHGVDMWVVPMREYNEDPVFSSIVSPTTMSARRRTIYLFYDPCAFIRADCARPFERLAMGGHKPSFGATNSGKSSRKKSKSATRDRSQSTCRACSHSTTDSRRASSKE
jgi:hypothetical protein